MNNAPKIFTTLANGITKEYTVILTFKNSTTNKDYVVYTDNNYDKFNKLKIFAAVYNPITYTYLGEPSTKEEWLEITNVLNQVI